jgi:C4-dicarboxylate-specific signal transduction histidine kinase
MGDLTASIAHEINQPLAAIVTHSEAALEFLDRDDPDLDEARDSLLSIAKNGMRAGEVIRGLRALPANLGRNSPSSTSMASSSKCWRSPAANCCDTTSC